MKTLIVEDELTSRTVLRKFLMEFGPTDTVVNGWEAVEAVRLALEEGSHYNLICLDIMMPEMDGHEALIQIRALEADSGIIFPDGAKIVMTTAVGNMESYSKAFDSLCDAYLVKPFSREKLVKKLRLLGLVK